MSIFTAPSAFQAPFLLAHRGNSACGRPTSPPIPDRSDYRARPARPYACGKDSRGPCAYAPRSRSSRSMRDGPGRVEIDAVIQRSGSATAFPLADDHAITPRHLVVFDGLCERRGDVDDDIAFSERKIHIGTAFREASSCLIRFRTETSSAGRGCAASRSRCSQAMARLEASDGLSDHVVIRSGRLVGGEIAAHQETPAQQIIVRPLNAEREFGLGGIAGHPPRTARSE